MRKALAVLLLIWIWGIHVYHVGTLAPPPFQLTGGDAKFYDKREFGIHQLVVSGDAYSRGLKAGQLTGALLSREEQELTTQLFHLVPQPVFLFLEIPIIEMFSGIERYLEPWMFQEMYGVSKSAPNEFDSLADGYTRQLAYHGLHEVGQMMVDQMGDSLGCTVVAYPLGSKWVLGRNFDFEGGRTLDREKIMKWIFPSDGAAYVSVIWAGMVGAVTAVNEYGIYLSLNAAGSSDRALLGTPSTLVLAKAMMRSKTAAEAIEILRNEKMFITDIFVLLDSATGELYRIEKSPKHTEVLRLTGPSVVTNHLVSERFIDDPVNRMRMRALTSVTRQGRAEELLRDERFASATSTIELRKPILSVMRDKAGLPPGNRQAIDSLIATHAVLFDSAEQVLFVSEGPALAGAFVGFDLKESFRQRQPVVSASLPRDADVTDADFEAIHASFKLIQAAEQALKRPRCDRARSDLDRVIFRQSYRFERTEGDYSNLCNQNLAAARAHWRRALELNPAYAQERDELQRKLQ